MFTKGYTNQEFGQAIGCSHSMASRIVNGQRLPGISLLEAISAKFDIPIDELLTARRKGGEAFGRLMQRRIVKPARASAKGAAKEAS